MRKLSSNTKYLLDSYDKLQYFVLAKIVLSSTTKGWATTPYNITASGVTYISGGVTDYDAPTFSTSLDRAEYQIVLSDPTQTLENELIADKAFSAPFYVYLGFYDPSTKQPLLDPADWLTVYEGLVDSWISQVSEKEKKFLIKGTSPMGALDWSNPFYTAPNTTKQFLPNDTTFDLNGSLLEDEITLKWGKK